MWLHTLKFPKNSQDGVKSLINPANKMTDTLLTLHIYFSCNNVIILDDTAPSLHKQHFPVLFLFFLASAARPLCDGCWRAADRHPSGRKHHCILCWASISHLLTNRYWRQLKLEPTKHLDASTTSVSPITLN